MAKIGKIIKYSAGDVFLIPASGDGFYVGQIAADTTSEIGAPFCYIYKNKITSIDDFAINLHSKDIISSGFITAELIKSGFWTIVENKKVPKHPSINTLDTLRANGFVGAIVTGGGLVGKFLDTFFGVIDRSIWPDISLVDRFFLNSTY